ncbi:MAG: pyridoxal phosphate-dependent aminotransferase, partial [Desulfobacterales bacterium]
GAFYLFPKSPNPDDVQFVNLLQEELILAIPGIAFGAPGYFRLSYAVPDATIEGSLPGFRRALGKVR